MGRAKVALKDVPDGEEYDKWLLLVPAKEKDEVSGEIHVTIQLQKVDYDNNNHPIANSSSNSLANSVSSVGTSSSSGSINNSNSSMSGSNGSSTSRKPTQTTLRTIGTSGTDEPELFTAIKNSELLKVETLMKDSKMDVNMRDEFGYTPLHAACCLFSDVDDQILSSLLQHKGIYFFLSLLSTFSLRFYLEKNIY